MIKIFLTIFLILTSNLAQSLECARDVNAIKKGGCTINSGLTDSMRILDEAEKKELGISCFKKAKLDFSGIKGTDCKITTSNSSNSAYYICNEHETAVSSCNEKPQIDYIKREIGENTYSGKKQPVDLGKEDFFTCYNKVKSAKPFKWELCSFHMSNSGRTAYADCPENKIEIYPCSGEKESPQLSIESNQINNTAKNKNKIIDHTADQINNEHSVGTSK